MIGSYSYLPDTFGEGFFFVQPVKFLALEVSARDDAYDAAFLNDRNMTKATIAHGSQRIDGLLFRNKRNRVGCHRVRERRSAALPFGEKLYCVAPGKDAKEPLMFVHDKNGANVRGTHSLASLLHGIGALH